MAGNSNKQTRALQNPLAAAPGAPGLESSAEGGELGTSDLEQGAPSSDGSDKVEKFYQPSSKCMRVTQGFLEFTTGKFTPVKTVCGYARVTISHAISVTLSGAVSGEFGYKNMVVVKGFLNQAELQRNVYWLSDYLAFACSFGPNVIVNGKTIQPPQRDEKCSKAAFIACAILAYGVALVPAGVFLKTMVVEEVPLWLLIPAGLARVVQLGNGLLALPKRLKKHYAFNKGLGPIGKIGHTAAVMTTFAATGILGWRDAKPERFDAPTADDWVSVHLGEFYQVLGNASDPVKYAEQSVNAITYSSCFFDLMFNGYSVFFKDIGYGFIKGEALFPIAASVGALGSGTMLADLLADSADTNTTADSLTDMLNATADYLATIALENMHNGTLPANGTDWFEQIQTPLHLASAFGINYSAVFNMTALGFVTMQLVTSKISRCCDKAKHKQQREGAYAEMKDEGEAESLPKQIADLLSWPCVLTSLAMLGYSSLVVGSLALATPFMVPNIYLKCKGAERNTNIEAKDVMLLVKDTRSARLIVPDKHEQQDANREQGKSCWQLLKEGCNSFWRCAMS